ncbi:MAG: hypothetical protein CEE38_17290 [Planctomycetes bacterium B3_Pla]|nr:MAG: hypothetical protein CEE38_17290 [Planctomycetes bacterium B3_Pla]
MRREKQTTKAFYKHSETDQVLVIERRCDGAIVGSCPATEPLKNLDSYQCSLDANLWIQESSDRLELM